MNTNNKKRGKDNELFYVDYLGRIDGWDSYRDNVDVVVENDKRVISDIYIRFVCEANSNGVAFRLSDGEFYDVKDYQIVYGQSKGEATKEDIEELFPLYNKYYLEKYMELYKNDNEWVEDMKNEGMVGIRDDFSVMADKMDILLPYGVCGAVRKFN